LKKILALLFFLTLFCAWSFENRGVTISSQEQSDQVLLLHFDGVAGSTVITDQMGRHNFIAVGNASLTTSDSVFGSASCYFDGSGDYLNGDGNAEISDFTFRTGDFTIDYWVKFKGTWSTSVTFHYAGTTLQLYGSNDNKLNIWCAGAKRISTTTTDFFSSGNWYHIAIVRASGVITLYINGVAEGGTYSDSTDYLNYSLRPRIGANETPNAYLKGYIDELRIVKGTAIWTSNFTPPTQAYEPNGTSKVTISSIMPYDLTAKAVAYYPMDDNAATTTIVESLNGWNATLEGGKTTNGADQIGRVGGAIRIVGGTDYISCLDANLKSALGNLTQGEVNFWIYGEGYSTAVNYYYYMISFVTSPGEIGTSSDGYLRMINPTTSTCYLNPVVSGTVNQWLANTTLFPNNQYRARGLGRWFNVRYCHNGVEASVYVNCIKDSLVFTTSTNKTKWWQWQFNNSGYTYTADGFYIQAMSNRTTGAVVKYSGTYWVDNYLFLNEQMTDDEARAWYNYGKGQSLLAGTYQ
jgi:hypothetical protein